VLGLAARRNPTASVVVMDAKQVLSEHEEGTAQLFFRKQEHPATLAV